MSAESVQAFMAKVASSPELQAQLRAARSPQDCLMMADAAGFELTGQDLSALAQQAYHQWLERLEPKLREFFTQVRHTPDLDRQLKACQSSAEVIALGQQCAVVLSKAELQRAAAAANAVPGFSFEKLWFQGLQDL